MFSRRGKENIKKSLMGLVVVAAIAVAIIAVVVLWPPAPKMPADHEGRTTCFECHEYSG